MTAWIRMCLFVIWKSIKYCSAEGLADLGWYYREVPCYQFQSALNWWIDRRQRLQKFLQDNFWIVWLVCLCVAPDTHPIFHCCLLIRYIPWVIIGWLNPAKHLQFCRYVALILLWRVEDLNGFVSELILSLFCVFSESIGKFYMKTVSSFIHCLNQWCCLYAFLIQETE